MLTFLTQKEKIKKMNFCWGMRFVTMLSLFLSEWLFRPKIYTLGQYIYFVLFLALLYFLCLERGRSKKMLKKINITQLHTKYSLIIFRVKLIFYFHFDYVIQEINFILILFVNIRIPLRMCYKALTVIWWGLQPHMLRSFLLFAITLIFYAIISIFIYKHWLICQKELYTFLSIFSLVFLASQFQISWLNTPDFLGNPKIN